MVWIWFLVALVLLAAALVLLRLDAKQRGGGTSGSARPERRTTVGSSPLGESPDDDHGDRDHRDNDHGDRDHRDDDEAPPLDVPADEVGQDPGPTERAGEPRLAPFQRSEASGIEREVAEDGPEPQVGTEPVTDDAPGDVVETAAAADGAGGPGADAEAGPDAVADFGYRSDTDTDASADAGADAVATRGPVADDGVAGPAPIDPGEPAAESSPRLLDRVRALLPARRQRTSALEPVEEAPADPLADSPVVRWLEDREFAPTPTPAPEFMHGDFSGGLSALGTVSHGIFRGRRAIMGVTGGRTVLALRRDTASDVVLDLSRPDVEAEPGFHDAGEVGALEARTSDYGRLDLIDRDRLVDAVREVPAGVRRIWAEGEWVAATVDGVDDPSTWDDVVVALHGAADVLAPFPPIGGRARALPSEIDPGSPGAAAGPEADPTVGMDGEVGTGTNGAPATAALPDPEDFAVVDDDEGTDAGTDGLTDEATVVAPDEDTSTPAPEPRRAGHLRLVPDRRGARDLTDVPVVADRGDPADDTADASTDGTAGDQAADEPATAVAAEPAQTAEPAVEEPDPFAEIMEPSGPVPARGDVAADHLAPRPPLSRPTRGVGQAYPEDASVPPLAAGATTGAAGIKPLGSEDDEDEIRDEVERFDAARIDGGSDLDRTSGGRHGADAAEENQEGESGRLTVADLAAKVGATPSGGRRHHRRAEPDEQADEQADEQSDKQADEESDDQVDNASGRERPGIDPDVEQTAKLRLPPDIRD
ncbi:hypothetical protein NGF75_07075 [Dietzia kunjamensis]|uniref:hypothetical protein n=1 Tax=Dietzia kunjamensis TaxID=322509 RepID=UPI002DBB81BE|nr:hypothetical protein [Dietzia kunjamensis]MEB8325748.1 hypothetical protein [Dietzia kunjamensis]